MAKQHQGRLELTWTDKDKTLLSAGDGRYDYTFVDPSDHRAQEVRLLEHIERVEAPAPSGRPVDLPAPTSENLLLTGDAMHVLDALAKIPEYANQYLNKIKLVYIDPPFNTGQAFTHYEDNIEHSVWLTMLRDRLQQILPLLAEDGSIWVHLDDVEVHRCRSVMDEELGSDNFVAEVVWQKADGTRNDAGGLSVDQDTILVYQKSSACSLNRIPRTAEDNARFASPDGAPELWFDDNPTAPGAATHQGMVYAIQHPITGELNYPPAGRHWGRSQEWFLAQMSEYAAYEVRDLGDEDKRATLCGKTVAKVRPGVEALMLAGSPEVSAEDARTRYDQGNWPDIILRSGGTGGLGQKAYVPSDGRVSGTWWSHELVGHNREAKSEIKALFKGRHAFATPKPERLLRRIIRIATNPGDVVLDCFAGSGTTAAVAHKMGRRWVASELLEDTIETFTKPRLKKVVAGDDPGGVTTTTTRVVAAGVELPSGVTARDAQTFQRVLRTLAGKDDEPLASVNLGKELSKVVRAASKSGGTPLNDEESKTLLALVKEFTGQVSTELDVSKQVQSQLKKATKTRDEVVINWDGGGGFTHVVVRPSMFTEVAGMILLADWATQGDLARGMCAQLSVAYEPEGIFAGKSGRTRLVVIDGLVGVSTVESVLERLDEREVVAVWATQIGDGAESALRAGRPGSRVSLIPDALLDQYRRSRTPANPFGKTSNDDEEDQ